MNATILLVKDVLKYTFGLVTVIAGIDKFTNLLTKWSQYLPEGLAELLPMEPHTFMILVGVVEIVAGILVLTITRIGAWVVMSWLIAIAITLIWGGHYFDVAVRDLVMAVGAFSLAKLVSDKNPV